MAAQIAAFPEGQMVAEHNGRVVGASASLVVVWGDIADPVLRFQRSQGFHYRGIIHNYLPEDGPSCGNAALIVWLNRSYRAAYPAAPVRKEET